MRIRLDPQDEYMHELESASNFNESMYFNVYDPAERVGGFLRLGNRANEGYAELTTCLYLPDGRVAFTFNRPKIENNDAFDAGGTRFDVVTPFEELRTTYDGKAALLTDPLEMADPRKAFTENPWVDAHVELTHTGVSPMYGGEPMNDDGSPLSDDHSGGFARGHYEQHMAVKGTIHVGDEEWNVDGFGLRDHSWGPRFWQAPWWYRWLTANFGPDFGFVVSIIASRDGGRRYGGMVLRDGKYEHIRAATIETDWRGADEYHREVRATATTANDTYEITGKVLNLIPLRNRRTAPDGEKLVTRISEGMTEWSCAGRTGYGLSEYLDQIVDGRPVGANEENTKPSRSSVTRIAALSKVLLAVALFASTLAIVNVTPAEAAPSWSITPSPNAPGFPTAEFVDVTCRSTANCFAVGSYETDNNTKPLTEHWDGAHWSILPVAPETPPSTSLAGVACHTDTACFAVGKRLIGASPHPWIEHWNGTRWVVQPGLLLFGSLSDIKCPTSTSCFAVGRNGKKTLVVHWDGAHWTRMNSVNPPQSSDSSLHGIACPSATLCVAVGRATILDIHGEGSTQPIIEHWDGNTWAFRPALQLGDGVELSGVTCPGLNDCFAVGSHGYTGFGPLIARWNGTSWSAVAREQPPRQLSSLSDVACNGATACFAVGTADLSGTPRTLIERWDGNAWTIAGSPNPPNGSPTLSSVYCPRPGTCIAVGESGNSTGTKTLAERWNGATWTLGTSPNPLPPGSFLRGVTCTSTTACLAVGFSNVAIFDSQPLALRRVGGSWKITPVPAREPPRLAQLSGVACATASNCFAVGWYLRKLSMATWRPLIEHWDGMRWSRVTVFDKPVIPGQLSDVTCPDATDCFAVGYGYRQRYGSVVMHWDGADWTVMDTPAPTASFMRPSLFGITCQTNMNCFAVGNFLGTSAYETLVEHWDGISWSVVASPTPVAPGGVQTALFSVACATDTKCFAVGAGGHRILEEWDGAHWSIPDSPDFFSPSSDPALAGVTCTGPSSCLAVGTGADAMTVIEQWDGSDWSLVTSPNPNGPSSLYGVDCPALTNCVAVGYTDAGDGQSTLIEQYSG